MFSLLLAPVEHACPRELGAHMTVASVHPTGPQRQTAHPFPVTKYAGFPRRSGTPRDLPAGVCRVREYIQSSRIHIIHSITRVA